jgi:hypothetical protein
MSMLSKALGGGGGSVPSLDTGKMLSISQQTAEKKRKLIQDRLAGLQPITQQYETQRKGLAAGIDPAAEKLIGQYGQDLSQVGQVEKDEGTLAADQFRQEQFRNVPEIQKAVRNQLAGNRMFGSGAALSSLAKPTLQAAQSASDFAARQEAERLSNQTQRAESLATTGFNVRQKAMADRMGIDEGTLDTLTQMGRTDLISKFNDLAGVESDLGQDALSIEQMRQMNDIAQAQAKAAKRSGFGSFLGSAAGLGIGALAGGPLGAAIGGQLGGQLGGMAGGGTPGQIDPTLMFALAQRNPKAQKTAYVQNMGQVPVRG